MPSLFDFTANSNVESMEALDAQGLQLKYSKQLFVVGTYNQEFYNGAEFNWAGGKLELFSEANIERDVYISVRTDFLDENTVLDRINNPLNQLQFETLDRFSIGQAEFMVLKSLLPCNTYSKINLKAQPEYVGDKRSLSIPISRILLAPTDCTFDLPVLRFALLTGTVNQGCGVYPFPNNSDKVADYFNNFAKELVNES